MKQLSTLWPATDWLVRLKGSLCVFVLVWTWSSNEEPNLWSIQIDQQRQHYKHRVKGSGKNCACVWHWHLILNLKGKMNLTIFDRVFLWYQGSLTCIFSITQAFYMYRDNKSYYYSLPKCWPGSTNISNCSIRYYSLDMLLFITQKGNSNFSQKVFNPSDS